METPQYISEGNSSFIRISAFQWSTIIGQNENNKFLENDSGLKKFNRTFDKIKYGT